MADGAGPRVDEARDARSGRGQGAGAAEAVHHPPSQVERPAPRRPSPRGRTAPWRTRGRRPRRRARRRRSSSRRCRSRASCPVLLSEQPATSMRAATAGEPPQVTTSTAPRGHPQSTRITTLARRRTARLPAPEPDARGPMSRPTTATRVAASACSSSTSARAPPAPRHAPTARFGSVSTWTMAAGPSAASQPRRVGHRGMRVATGHPAWSAGCRRATALPSESVRQSGDRVRGVVSRSTAVAPPRRRRPRRPRPRRRAPPRCPGRGRAGRTRRRARARPPRGCRVSRLAPAMSSASVTIDAVEAELVAQHVLQERASRRWRGCPGRARARGCAAVMTHATPRVDRGREGQQLALAQDVGGAVDDRQVEVRVAVGVAVPGEVLGAGRDPGGLQALDPGRGVPGDQVGVGAEAADADDRVVGRGVHVDDRARGRGHADARRGRRRSVAAAARVSSRSSSRPSTALPG